MLHTAAVVACISKVELDLEAVVTHIALIELMITAANES